MEMTPKSNGLFFKGALLYVYGAVKKPFCAWELGAQNRSYAT